ncbi:MAG: putative transposase, partial [Candidatus Endobugula sp.]
MKESHSIKLLCEVFEVHRSSYRYWKVNANKISSGDVYTDSEVKAAYVLSGGSAGSRT